MHHCARFFVEIAAELYFSRLKMVKRKEISVQKQTQIIILQKTDKNYRDIAKILKISLCSVHTEYRETGQNTNRERSGRPHGKKFGRNAALPLVLLRHYSEGQLQRSS